MNAVLDKVRKEFPFMFPATEQQHETESYVAVPPALIITDELNQAWTLGFQTCSAVDYAGGQTSCLQ